MQPKNEPSTLTPCTNRLCDRWVGGSALYCCGPCATADTPPNRYEIHEEGPLSHTGPCNQRQASRGQSRLLGPAPTSEPRHSPGNYTPPTVPSPDYPHQPMTLPGVPGSMTNTNLYRPSDEALNFLIDAVPLPLHIAQTVPLRPTWDCEYIVQYFRDHGFPHAKLLGSADNSFRAMILHHLHPVQSKPTTEPKMRPSMRKPSADE